MNVLWRGGYAQQIRIVSGLILFAFAATHFFNLALGLLSIDAMENFQTIRFAVTRSTIGTAVLVGCFVAHMAFSLVRFVERRSWKFKVWEWVQLISGLIIPLLLIEHAFGMRLKAGLFGTLTYYQPSLVAMWPGAAAQQTALLLVVWVHCCVGLHYWLRLASWYRPIAPWLFGLAILLPALALTGFMVSGRQAVAAVQGPAAIKQVFDNAQWPTPAQNAQIDHMVRWGLLVFSMIMAGIGAVMLSRLLGFKVGQKFAVTYSGGPTVDGRIGDTLLEVSQRNNIPHISVCGGRARCSTCRVKVEAGGAELPPAQFAEAVTLGAIKAPEGVRLACQLQPTAPLTVRRLIMPKNTGQKRSAADLAEEQGIERVLAVMFLDVRGFTRLSEKKLPYDVVFLLNRFFAALGDAVQSEGGWIDKYMGDGLLAVFGRETGTEAGCRSAIRASARIDEALDRLNTELGAEVGEPIQVGIGLHVGPLVLGRIGHPDSAAMTVIGSTVNTCSRLESMTKELKCQLVISKDCARSGGLELPDLTPQTVNVRGLVEPIAVFAIPSARTLVDKLTPASRPVAAE